MIDRRKNPREFFVSGWDPYVIQLTTANRDSNNKKAVAKEPEPEPTTTRWRAMLIKRSEPG